MEMPPSPFLTDLLAPVVQTETKADRGGWDISFGALIHSIAVTGVYPTPGRKHRLMVVTSQCLVLPYLLPASTKKVPGGRMQNGPRNGKMQVMTEDAQPIPNQHVPLESRGRPHKSCSCLVTPSGRNLPRCCTVPFTLHWRVGMQDACGLLEDADA